MLASGLVLNYCGAIQEVHIINSSLMPLLQQHGRAPIDLLTRQQLEQYINSLTHLSYTTHNRHQATLQSLLNFAVEQGYLSANPLPKLKRRKPDREKGERGSDEIVRYLTPEQHLPSFVKYNSIYTKLDAITLR